MKIEGNKVPIPLRTRFAVNKSKKNLEKEGYGNIKALANARGDVAVLSYDLAENGSLLVANIIKRDGDQIIIHYNNTSEDYNSPYTRTITSWGKGLYDSYYSFKKDVELQYNGKSKIPETIVSINSDIKSHTGLRKTKKSPCRLSKII
ncbi:hypothetical protein IJ182_05415 [bacterium]|nr:hypothetical protein [bacterium]